MQLLGDGVHLAMALFIFNFYKEHKTALISMTEDNYDHQEAYLIFCHIKYKVIVQYATTIGQPININ